MWLLYANEIQGLALSVLAECCCFCDSVCALLYFGTQTVQVDGHTFEKRCANCTLPDRHTRPHGHYLLKGQTGFMTVGLRHHCGNNDYAVALAYVPLHLPLPIFAGLSEACLDDLILPKGYDGHCNIVLLIMEYISRASHESYTYDPPSGASSLARPWPDP